MSFLRENVPFFNPYSPRSPILSIFEEDDIKSDVRHYLTGQVSLDDLGLDSPVRRRSSSPVRRRSSPVRRRSSPVRRRSSPEEVSSLNRHVVKSPTLRQFSSTREVLLNSEMDEKLFDDIKSRVDKDMFHRKTHDLRRRINNAQKKLQENEKLLNYYIFKRESYLEDCRNRSQIFSQIKALGLDKDIEIISSVIANTKKEIRDMKEMQNREIILPQLTREEYIERYNKLKRKNKSYKDRKRLQ